MTPNHAIETDAVPAPLPLLALACAAHCERWASYLLWE